MCVVKDKEETRLMEMLKEAGCSVGALYRLSVEGNLKGWLLEMQAIYDSKKALRDEAYKKYKDNKLTMSTFVDEASFSRPTLYGDNLLKKYAEFLVRKSSENDPIKKMEQAIKNKQEVERYNEALVRDVIELLHNKEDCDKLAEEVDFLKNQIAYLKKQQGVKVPAFPMERRVVTTPNNLEGVFPVELHRD